MTKISQLRIYTIREGNMDEWIMEWTEKIQPLRLRMGFEIDGAWVNEVGNKFIWILSYKSAEDWEYKQTEYYNSDERVSMEPNPARNIESIDEEFITSIA